MSYLLLLLLAPAQASTSDCPAKVGNAVVQSLSETLATQLARTEDKATTTGRLLGLTLACTPDPTPETAARAFLLLGAYENLMGEQPNVQRYFRAAYALGGEKAWDPALGTDLAAWYKEIGEPCVGKGVIFAPRDLFTTAPHLVGAVGDSPWTMTAATYTFQAGKQSVPVSANAAMISIVTPRYINEFNSLVDGVSEAELDLPAYPEIIAAASGKTSLDSPTKTVRPPANPDTATGQNPPDVPDEPDVVDESPDWVPPVEEPDPPPPKEPFLAIRPHVGVGAAIQRGAPARADLAGIAPADAFTALGPQLSLGLAMHLGKSLIVEPELGLRPGWGASPATSSDPSTSLYDGQAPVDSLGTTFHLGYVGLPFVLHRSSLLVGVGPMMAFGTAQVLSGGQCATSADGEEPIDCLASYTGKITAMGANATLGARGRWWKVFPRFDLAVLGASDRLYLSSALSVVWEGNP